MSNKVVLIGHVASEPVLQSNTSGNPLLKFRLVEKHQWSSKDKQPRSKSVEHRIIFWGPLAADLYPKLREGDLVLVDGMLEYHEFTDRQQQQQSAAQISARSIDVLLATEVKGVPR